ncbi:MAG: hypothetical protein VKO21_00025 [Candidatus Sericytochromatia bacterium]|nr:hypothetical protein [Candidatus Sericytochromatia bacterium]
MRVSRLWWTGLVLTLVLPGCGGKAAVKGQRTVVETSQSGRPDWINKRSWESGDRFYVVGTSGPVQDISLGEQIAELNGKRLIADYVGQQIRSQFDLALTGNPNADRVGKAVASCVSSRTDKVVVRGVLPVERYWERYEIVGEDGISNGLEVSVIVGISKTDLEASKRGELKALGQMEQIQADAEAKRLLEQFRTAP